MKKETREGKSLFGVYCLLLVWFVLFKGALSPEELSQVVGHRSINLIPFNFQDAGASQSSDVLMNILLFIPFGLYLKMMGMKAGIVVAWGAMVSFALETLQFGLAVGASDITDLIANVIGTALGVCAFELVLKLFGTEEKAQKAVNVMTIVAMGLWLLVKMLLLDAAKSA